MASAAQLPEGTAHLWRIDLGGPPPQGIETTLDEAERARAARLAFERDRHRFLWARVAVRDILGSYAGIAPGCLAFQTAENGKPHLATSLPWEFNLSHSGDIGILAVTRGTPVGVDVETTGSPRDMRPLADSLCTVAEKRSLDSLAGSEHFRAFLTCWTRKEACLKAIGAGLSLPPRDVEVGIEPDCRRIAILSGTAPQHVSVATVGVGEDWIAALAMVGGRIAWEDFTWHGRLRR